MISDFVPNTQLTGNTKYNILSRPDTKLSTSFGLEIGSSMLKHYNEYFDYPLTAKEFNHISIPNNDSLDYSISGWSFIGNR